MRLETSTRHHREATTTRKTTTMTNTNTGNYNTGHYNTGRRNTGDYNTGNYNTGNRNTGNRNTGYYNTGYYNTGYYNTGFFMTTTQDTVEVFNGNATVDRSEFVDALPGWLWKVDPTEHDGDMHKAYAAAWKASDQDWDKVEAIPGFHYGIWVEITGISAPDPNNTTPETIFINNIEYRRIDS